MEPTYNERMLRHRIEIDRLLSVMEFAGAHYIRIIDQYGQDEDHTLTFMMTGIHLLMDSVRNSDDNAAEFSWRLGTVQDNSKRLRDATADRHPQYAFSHQLVAREATRLRELLALPAEEPV